SRSDHHHRTQGLAAEVARLGVPKIGLLQRLCRVVPAATLYDPYGTCSFSQAWRFLQPEQGVMPMAAVTLARVSPRPREGARCCRVGVRVSAVGGVESAHSDRQRAHWRWLTRTLSESKAQVTV